MNKKVVISLIVVVVIVAAVLDLMNQGLGYRLMPQFLKDITDSVFGN